MRPACRVAQRARASARAPASCRVGVEVQKHARNPTPYILCSFFAKQMCRGLLLVCGVWGPNYYSAAVSWRRGPPPRVRAADSLSASRGSEHRSRIGRDVGAPAPPIQPIEDEKIDKKKPWTQEEDDTAPTRRKQQRARGRPRAEIAKHLPGRNGKQCRERWHNRQRSGDPVVRRVAAGGGCDAAATSRRGQ